METLKKENAKLKVENSTLKNEVINLKETCAEVEESNFSLTNIKRDLKAFKSYTGLTLDRFEILFNFVDPGKNGEHLKYYEAAKRNAQSQQSTPIDEEHDYCKPRPKKSGPKPKLDTEEQLFAYLVWSRCGFPEWHVAKLFKVPTSTINRYLITWANYLNFSLGSIPIWPTQSDIQSTMPQCFKDTYPSTRTIIDCTELFVQVPSSLNALSALYSFYKHHCTYKAPVGISPSGSVTFVSALYPGNLSDREITQRSGLLNPLFWNKGDSIMADRGFTIEEDLKPLGVSLNILAFLDGRDQLEEEEVIESQAIASVRIHVERLMSRVKKFKIVQTEIPLSMHGSINQVWTVCCLLCNFMNPLVKDKPSS